MLKNYIDSLDKLLIRHEVTSEQYHWAINYASSILLQGLPVIFDPKHLADLVGLDFDYFKRFVRQPKKFYREYSIQKKKGGYRLISEPLPNLKQAQHWILNNILYKIPKNKFINSYTKGRSIVDNARFHRKQVSVLNMDIENYFPTINYDLVLSFFKGLGYNNLVCIYLAKICTYNDSLPQGGITSPSLSNLLTKKLDHDLFKICRTKDLRYSRYADDITVSGDFDHGEVINIISQITENNGFTINVEKTRVFRSHQRQIVTGLVVNEKISVPREYKKKIRQEIYFIKKFGFYNHMKQSNIIKENYLNHLIGKCYYVYMVEPNNKENNSYIKYLKSMKIN